MVHAEKVQNARALVDDEDGTRADHEVVRRHIFIGIRLVENIGTCNFAGCTAKLNQTNPASIGNAAGQSLDNVADLYAERHFKNAGISYIARDRNHLRADGFFRTRVHIIFLFIHEKMRNEGKAFDVVQACRACKETADFDIRRFCAWTPRLSLDGTQECGTLAADIGARTGVEMQVEIHARAKDVLSEKALFLCLPNGIVEQCSKTGIFCAHIDVAVCRTADIGTDCHRLDEIEGILLDKFAILERCRLAFVGVADDDFILAFDGACLAPLAPERILCTAAPFDFCGTQHIGDSVGIRLKGTLKSRISANF